MSKIHNDIDDNEIRFIVNGYNNTPTYKSQESDSETDNELCYSLTEPDTLPTIISSHHLAPTTRLEPLPKKRNWIVISAIIAILFVIGLVAALCYIYYAPSDEIPVEVVEPQPVAVEPVPTDTIVAEQLKSYAAIRDTTAAGRKFTVFTPVDATPGLELGAKSIFDSTATLIVQAADIRGDNGQILGAFVLDGELISTGQSKSGFCAIIGGEITIGVANATPYLEAAIDEGGDFFRQYPLVVGSQIVENKPIGRSFRKALAELDGKIRVIISRERMTFHEFSQALVGLGVKNAIYLVGSTSYGYARAEDGSLMTFGKPVYDISENVSYLVWK